LEAKPKYALGLFEYSKQMSAPNEEGPEQEAPEPDASAPQRKLPEYSELELQRDLTHLMIVEPFFAHVFQGMGRQITKRIDTAAVCWTGEMYLLLVNAAFFAPLTLRERCAVLKHEVLHIVFRHLTRGKGYHPTMFNVAADLVINQLCEGLPEGCLNIENFQQEGLDFPPNGTTEEYYAILRTKKDAAQWCEVIWGKGSNGRGNHVVWTEGGEGDRTAADWRAGDLVLRAGDLLRQKNIQAWGTLPLALRRELQRLAEERAPKVHWKQALRTFVSGSSRSRLGQTVCRQSKRFGTHPGTRIRRQKKVLVAIDTSGSTQGYLEDFYAELRHLWKCGVQMYVVECDCNVAAAYPFNGKLPERVHGGGGTAFDPVFDWMRSVEGKKAGPFDGCIYFTDGYAARPQRPPQCRLLWVLPPQENAEFNPQQPLAAEWQALHPGTIIQLET
jgi:predicted metal-dependent peptidase